jgi:hypothetical protein
MANHDGNVGKTYRTGMGGPPSEYFVMGLAKWAGPLPRRAGFKVLKNAQIFENKHFPRQTASANIAL